MLVAAFLLIRVTAAPVWWWLYGPLEAAARGSFTGRCSVLAPGYFDSKKMVSVVASSTAGFP